MKNKILLALLLGCLLFILDINFLSCDLTPDDLMYAQETESFPSVPESAWRPAHILWDVESFAAYKLFRAFQPQSGAVYPMQILNTLLSCLSTLLLLLLLSRLTGSSALSTAVALLFHFSARPWQFSLHPKLYFVAVFFQILAIFFLSPAGGGGSHRPLLAGFFQGMAILNHLSLAPLLAAGFLYELLPQGRSPFRLRIKKANLFLLPALLIPLSVFLCVHAFILKSGWGGSPRLFFDWLLMKGTSRGPWHIQHELSLLLQNLKELVIGPLTAPEPMTAFWLKIYGMALRIQPILNGLLAVPVLLAFLFTLLSLPAWIRQKAEDKKCGGPLNRWLPHLPLVILLFLTLLLLLTSFYLSDPINDFLFVILVPFFLIFGLFVSSFTPHPGPPSSLFRKALLPAALFLLTGLLLAFNFFILTGPAARVENNVALKRVLSFQKVLTSQDVIVASGLLPEASYFRYFLGARVLDVWLFMQIYTPGNPMGQNFYEALEETVKIEMKSGRRVLLYSGILGKEAERAMKEYPPPPGMELPKLREFFAKNYRMKVISAYDRESRLLRLTRVSGLHN